MYTQIVGGKQRTYPLKEEMAWQYIEEMTGLSRQKIASKLGIKTVEDKYPLVDKPQYKANF